MPLSHCMSDSSSQPQRDLEDFAGIASDWFWETDAEHRFSYFSKRMEEVTKFNSFSLIGQRRNVIPSESLSDPKWVQHLADLEAHRPFHHFEYKILRPNDGSLLWVRISGEPIFDAHGQFMGYRGVGHDVTIEKQAMASLESSNAVLAERNRELREARAALERAACEDALTRLANRRAFENDLQSLLGGDPRPIALLHVDLDRFKWVNDTLGHPAGDRVLQTAAARMQLATGERGRVYRLGGDEFVLLLTETVSDAVARSIGEAVLAAMNEPIRIGRQRVSVGASLGAAVADSQSIDAPQLIGRADAALYKAKRNGRQQLCFCTDSLQASIEEHRQLGSDMPGALERGEFIPFFQPQFDMRRHEVIGVEALVRWQHPQRGLLAPGHFLGVAIERGLMETIDRQMLQLSMQVVHRLAQQGIALPGLSVNISEARLADAQILRDIDTLWTDRRCRLSIELLETIDFGDFHEERTLDLHLEALRQMGVGIDTDDFGSGRASLASLLRVQPERLKIDRNLVREVVSSARQRTLVKSIVDMGQGLGLQCLAEGVETAEDIAVMQELGCHLFQGYALGRPMSEQDLVTFLADHTLASQSAGIIGGGAPSVSLSGAA